MSYYYNAQHHQPLSSSHSSSSSHNHHGGRSRRAPRISNPQYSHRQFRGVKSMKDLSTERNEVAAARIRFEAARSFDFDDDEMFCSALLTDEDYHSVHSSSSDGSLSSDSPNTSPLQHQVQPSQQVTPGFSLSSASNNSYNPATGFQSNNNHHMTLHQPSALRTRNAIPIVNPSTGMRVASPPSSISPAMMQQQTYARRW